MQNFDINIMPFLQAFMVQLIIIAVVYLFVMVAIFLDLWAGIRKAKASGEFRSSYGLRKTVGKIGDYYNMLFIVTIIDALQMLLVMLLNYHTNTLLPILPFLTFGGGIFACVIEGKSIYEKKSDKDKAKVAETAKALSEILKNKDNQEIIGSFLEYIKKEKPQQTTE